MKLACSLCYQRPLPQNQFDAARDKPDVGLPTAPLLLRPQGMAPLPRGSQKLLDS